MSRSGTDYTPLLGRRVKWSSQGAGVHRDKQGTVIAVRKDKAAPWQWLSEDHRRLNDVSPAGEHTNGRTDRYASPLARVIVLLDRTGDRQVNNRYATPHGSLLSIIDEPQTTEATSTR